MSLAALQLSDGFNASVTRCEPYEPSIASTASSSQITVFSDTESTQSSVASSISDDFRSCQEDVTRDQQQAKLELQAQQPQLLRPRALHEHAQEQAHKPASYAQATSLPVQHRQHPRRCSLARNQKPPPLVRQCERKLHFVENLVDSATQMVEVIWPLSSMPCKNEAGTGRGVLPLRRYIEETLRRSRTSYSTLQVALYYLILIKPHVPKVDFTKEQSADCSATRALMCGRRMFLAALILASKYLQDRNYSAKAWSKMSGLQIGEINTNERTFLAKVSWKLHIPEPIFKRWTDVVLRYTPNLPPSAPGHATTTGNCPISWKQIVPLLTPELDRLPMQSPVVRPAAAHCLANYSFASSPSPATPVAPGNALAAMTINSTSQVNTPTPANVVPRFLEPKSEPAGPPTPALMRMGPLPTPQLTPSSVASSTPAASACSSRRPSICSAMAMAQQSGFNRCAMDCFPGNALNSAKYKSSRRPSVASASSGSSPESMMSDNSRSSRSSSISSVTTASTNSSSAPRQACLARQATCRNIGLPIPASVKEEKEGTAAKPIMIVDSDVEMLSSPEFASFSISDKVLTTPHKHSKFAPRPTSAPTGDKGRKRARPRGNRRSELQEECRLLLDEELDAMVEDDEYVTSPSPASARASTMLRRSGSEANHLKEAQPPASFQRKESLRLPVQKNEGKKRTCCSGEATMHPPSFREMVV